MHWPNPDIIIFSCFLAANLILGLQAGRRVKSLQGYAIGDKEVIFGTQIKLVHKSGDHEIWVLGTKTLDGEIIINNAGVS